MREIRSIFDKAIHNDDHFPSIKRLEEISRELGFAAREAKWRYMVVEDCLKCGGHGYHWIKTQDKKEVVTCCNDCEAGRNLQKAPPPHITHTMKDHANSEYLGPYNWISGRK